jgi:hypothetical protein
LIRVSSRVHQVADVGDLGGGEAPDRAAALAAQRLQNE